MSNLSKGIIPHLILAVIVIIFYGNTLANGFVHDDVWQVKDRPFSEIFKSCVAEEILGGCQRGFYWRPMQYVSYFLTFRISASPTAFHLFNLVYFWMAGILVYRLTALIGADLKPFGEPQGKQMSADSWLPFVAAVIFVAHPVNSEVVNWVSATPELLMVIFSLLTLIFFIKYLRSLNKLQLLISVGFFFLALLSKETAAFLFFALPAYLFIVRVRSRTYLKILFYLIPLFVYLGLRSAVLGRVVYKYEGYYALSAREQVMTALALFPRYLLKLVYPLPLSFQPLILPIKSFDWQVGAGLGMLGLLGILVFFHLRGVSRKFEAHLGGVNLRLLAFGLFLILVGLVPPLIFANKLGQFIFSERYLLFSTAGLAIAAAALVSRVKVREMRVIGGVGVILLLFFWFVVVQRNRDWNNNAASYRAMIRVDQDNWNAHLGLGRLYEAAADFESSKGEFRQVMTLDPGNLEARGELGFLENEYSFDNVYSFHFPMGWNVSRDGKRVIVSKADVKVEITQDTKKPNQTYDQYVSGWKTRGEVANQGLAQIPGVDVAYVRIYKGESTTSRDSISGMSRIQNDSLEFFLFKGEKVVRVYLSGAKSQADMNNFNRILGSIRIEQR